MDAWKVFCLALTAFPFTLLHHTKILLDVKKFALFFFKSCCAKSEQCACLALLASFHQIICVFFSSLGIFTVSYAVREP